MPAAPLDPEPTAPRGPKPSAPKGARAKDTPPKADALAPWRSSAIKAELEQDFVDTYRYYLTVDEQDRLGAMNPFERGVMASFWIVRNTVMRLPPTRRGVLLMALLFFIVGVTGEPVLLTLSFPLLLATLFLELKDKLVAQDELETGRAVQLALMPEAQPDFPGWELWLFTRPAREVGGDLVDSLRFRADRMGVALGDIAGKGLGAALVMANLQATLRALVPQYSDLDALGREVNQILCRDGLPHSFASLLYLDLYAEAGLVRVLNAGHHPPLMVHQGEVKEMPRGGPALGLLPTAPFAEQRVELPPGAFLVVYSDGVTEARNAAGAFFEEERLMRILPRLATGTAEQLGQDLLAVVDRFVGEARPSDDLSLVVLRRI